MDLQSIFDAIRKNKSVTDESLTQLRAYITNNNIKSLSLWNMTSNFRFLLKFGKAQLNFLAFAGFTIFPLLMYEKYLKDPSKATTLAIITPIVSLLLLTPSIYFRRFYRNLLSEISYDPISK